MKEIALIEDDHILRSSYLKYFNLTNAFSVLFCVNDIPDAIAEKHLQPQIILLDINLPSGSGIDQIPVLKQHFPDSKIVILSSLENPILTRQALEAGAVGFLLKSSSLAYIAESLMKVDDGGSPFSPATVSHMLQAPPEEPLAEPGEFTKRELELIKLISEGVANKTAADRLNVTYFTINQHLKNIYKKLNINSKSELISWYLNRRK